MGKDKKICPLLSIGMLTRDTMGGDKTIDGRFSTIDIMECREKECAWWDTWNKRCAMLTITHSKIKEHLMEIGEGWECSNCKFYEGDASWGKCSLLNEKTPSCDKCKKWEYPNEQD